RSLRAVPNRSSSTMLRVLRTSRLTLTALVGLAAILLPTHPLAAQTAADSAGIRQAALDYIEGWYAGDADRMARAVHPELATRIARNTGDAHAAAVSSRSARSTPASVNGSVGSTPKSRLPRNRVSARAPAVPKSAPSPTSHAA